MTEAFLHYVWQHQLLNEGLATVDGKPVVVLKAGEHNLNAGPDFFGSRVRIDGVEWAGNVEIHIKSSQWRAHGHGKDAAYNNVILHVVYEYDGGVILENGEQPPTLELKQWLHPSLVANYEALQQPCEGGGMPCWHRLSEVPEFVVGSWLDRMATERLEEKSAVVEHLLQESRGGWEDVCYWLIARYFGGKVNGLAFEMLAKATDQRLLARWRDNPERLEALLMGQAGLLEGYFEDDYPRQLQADYEAIRLGSGLRPMGGYLWKFYKLRPSSFPTIRISQFAHLVSTSVNLFSTLLEQEDVKEMEKLFNQRASEYWETHYRFDQRADKSMVKHVGKVQADLLIMNAWVPLLFVYGTSHGQERYRERAMDLLRQLVAEDNVVVRGWQSVGVKVETAADSQALLQLSGNYCQQRRCLECRIGFQILKKK